MPRQWSPPDADVTILAGDVATGVVGVMWAAEKFGARPVVYVAGNHEFYGSGRRYFRHLEKLKAKAEEMNAQGANIHVLENDAVVIDGTRFLGCTLWADFDLYGTAPISQQIAQREMNDYNCIRLDHGRMLTAADTAEFHRASRFWLSETLRQGHDGPTVVVTHHAPSEMSSHPRYRGDPCTPAYASRLEGLICDLRPALWVHGHMHNSSDYTICDTRVVVNPRGYVGHELNPDFDPNLVIEVQ